MQWNAGEGPVQHGRQIAAGPVLAGEGGQASAAAQIIEQHGALAFGKRFQAEDIIRGRIIA